MARGVNAPEVGGDQGEGAGDLGRGDDDEQHRQRVEVAPPRQMRCGLSGLG